MIVFLLQLTPVYKVEKSVWLNLWLCLLICLNA